MPELPEVEQVRRSLEPWVVGKTIRRVEVRLARIIRTPPNPVLFANRLAGRTVTGIARRGKYLLFSVPPDTLVSHLRMEGQYRLEPAGAPLAPHTHVVFQFTDGSELRYRDVRQFGTMDLVGPDDPLPPGLAALGMEPFDPRLTAEVLRACFARRRAPVKAVLLDQTVVAGIGNIYADEALFLARIHPQSPACRLSQAEAARLLAALRDVLTRAIAAGGSSIRTYADGYGRHGGFQVSLAAYGRAGAPCPRCGTPIAKVRVAGRGTHFCPVCQPSPGEGGTA
ncbi:formamidopyrimidine-DNA glycosylase [Alicyclobacillus cellulosilyticus]|uniref:Formamidopyrimidine-DNA glycosylase n=1 Tax=Alicyclobacillus cellulosilyticus TaxID=1003997 RepID=A0A917KHT1_9BACL|nr:bifunctional DNA-formamidopyrimidine glycosylase/DNA-(apurinic or apyrimidinic site) lyase [Alicyclobacillus cellulosilyticus]GGJ13451.1 formamidopyrimidine-DNA glycosylase [Alicyclobacillus cellulosilyticus]